MLHTVIDINTQTTRKRRIRNASASVLYKLEVALESCSYAKGDVNFIKLKGLIQKALEEAERINKRHQ